MSLCQVDIPDVKSFLIDEFRETNWSEADPRIVRVVKVNVGVDSKATLDCETLYARRKLEVR